MNAGVAQTRMNSAVCNKAIVAFLFWYIVLGSVHCIRHCVACTKSYATCNDTSRSCKSNCFQKKICPNSDDLCLATWVSTQAGFLVVFTDCFPLPPYSSHTKYRRRCEGQELNNTVTCLCSGNSCNKRVYRALKVAPKREVPRVSSRGVATDHGDKGDTPSDSSVSSTPAFVCIASLAVLTLLFLFVCGTRQRKTNTHPATIRSQTESAEDKQEQQKFILQRQLGRGRFGVWTASLKGENVTVKLFPRWAAREYKNERDFFLNQSSTDHSNILKFIAAGEGVFDGDTEHQYWLITEYCHKGSLRDYLKGHVLNREQTLVFLHGISSGVTYLHADRLFDKVKIPVAHRDLKSTNILVKENGTCVLADFDSATALNCGWDTKNSQAGTYRYMSPEELDASVNLEAPDVFKQMDVYSMALVLWEVMSRCAVTGPCETYSLPYQFAVGGLEPDLEIMIKVVVQQNQRPPLNGHWELNKEMETLCDTLQECWDSDPEARLTADCVRLRTRELLSHTVKPTNLRIA